VGQHKGRLVLAIEVTAQLQGAVTFCAVHEDGDCQQVVADGEFATGEDRPGRDAELVRASLALPELPGPVAVEGRTAAARAVRGTSVVGPADQFERLESLLIGHTGHGR